MCKLPGKDVGNPDWAGLSGRSRNTSLEKMLYHQKVNIGGFKQIVSSVRKIRLPNTVMTKCETFYFTKK